MRQLGLLRMRQLGLLRMRQLGLLRMRQLGLLRMRQLVLLRMRQLYLQRMRQLYPLRMRQLYLLRMRQHYILRMEHQLCRLNPDPQQQQHCYQVKGSSAKNRFFVRLPIVVLVVNSFHQLCAPIRWNSQLFIICRRCRIGSTRLFDGCIRCAGNIRPNVVVYAPLYLVIRIFCNCSIKVNLRTLL
jgi:hypothetical protein